LALSQRRIGSALGAAATLVPMNVQANMIKSRNGQSHPEREQSKPQGRPRVYRKVVELLASRTIWIADAHRGDGKRFVVLANEKLIAFLELESAICSISLSSLFSP
jgi:hypothetical protein